MVLVPVVNLDRVQANQNPTMHRITVEPCGLKGLRSTTAPLSEEQYHILQQYLVSFRERLNTTTDYNETVRLYTEALTKLADLHLIPRNSHPNLQGNPVLERGLTMRYRRASYNEDFNMCALVTGSISGPDNFLPPLYMLLELPLVLIIMILRMAYYHYRDMPIVYAIGVALATFAEWRLHLDTNTSVSIFDNIEGPTIGWVHSLGLNGIKQWNGTLTMKPHFLSNWIVFWFTGYKILDEERGTHFFIGTCLCVKIHVI